jgi:hypothetical protein
MDHALVLLFGLVFVGLGILVGRNSQRLSRGFGGTWVSPRTVDGRDGVFVLMGVFCVVMGVLFVCVGIATML